MANMPDGVIVSRVNPNSAASGKINRGDLITMIQYKGKKYEVSDVESFTEALENFSSGNKCALLNVHLQCVTMCIVPVQYTSSHIARWYRPRTRWT